MEPTHTTKRPRRGEIDELMREIARYLDAVETFRAEGCEPTWSAGAGLGG